MRIIVIAFSCLIFVGCKFQRNDTSRDKTVVNDNPTIESFIEKGKLENYPKIGVWQIHGTEPFWNIYLHNDTFLLTKVNVKIDSVYLTMNGWLMDDPDHITIWLKDTLYNESRLHFFKKSEPLSDGMSDKSYHYYARLIYNSLELKGVAEKK